MNYMQNHSGRTTKLEVKGYSLLDELGIRHERQYLLFEKFCVDAWVEECNLVIQFDGDYWHGHPIKYPNPDRRQRKKYDQRQGS